MDKRTMNKLPLLRTVASCLGDGAIDDCVDINWLWRQRGNPNYSYHIHHYFFKEVIPPATYKRFDQISRLLLARRILKRAMRKFYWKRQEIILESTGFFSDDLIRHIIMPYLR